MPNFGTHLSGPLAHTIRFRDQSERAWYRDLPIGTNDPDAVHHFVDFVQVDDYNTTAYTLSSSGTGTSAAVNTSSSAINGTLLIQTGSTAGNYATVQNKAVSWLLDRSLAANTHALQSAKKTWYEASFSVDTTSTDVDCFIGLSETQANPVQLSQNYIGFMVSNTGNTIKMVSSTAGVATSSTAFPLGTGTSQTISANGQVKVGFLFTEANNVMFYINRTFMGQFTAGSLPSCPLAETMQVRTNSATNRFMLVDYFYVCKTR